MIKSVNKTKNKLPKMKESDAYKLRTSGSIAFDRRINEFIELVNMLKSGTTRSS